MHSLTQHADALAYDVPVQVRIKRRRRSQLSRRRLYSLGANAGNNARLSKQGAVLQTTESELERTRAELAEVEAKEVSMEERLAANEAK